MKYGCTECILLICFKVIQRMSYFSILNVYVTSSKSNTTIKWLSLVQLFYSITSTLPKGLRIKTIIISHKLEKYYFDIDKFNYFKLLRICLCLYITCNINLFDTKWITVLHENISSPQVFKEFFFFCFGRKTSYEILSIRVLVTQHFRFNFDLRWHRDLGITLAFSGPQVPSLQWWGWPLLDWVLFTALILPIQT